MIDLRVGCGGSQTGKQPSRVDKRLVALNSYVNRLGNYSGLIMTERNPSAFIRWESARDIFDECIIRSTSISIGDLR